MNFANGRFPSPEDETERNSRAPAASHPPSPFPSPPPIMSHCSFVPYPPDPSRTSPPPPLFILDPLFISFFLSLASLGLHLLTASTIPPSYPSLLPFFLTPHLPSFPPLSPPSPVIYLSQSRFTQLFLSLIPLFSLSLLPPPAPSNPFPPDSFTPHPNP